MLINARVGQRLDHLAPLLLTLVVVAGSALLLLGLAPGSLRPFKNPALHVGVGTAISVIGLLAAYLLLERFRTTRALSDLLLVSAFTLLVLTNLFFTTLPELGVALPGKVASWSSAIGRALGALTFAAAAIWPPRRVDSPRALPAALAGAVGLLVAAALVTVLVEGTLSAGVMDFTSQGLEEVAASSAFLLLQLVTAAALAAATIGFARRAVMASDQLYAWLSAATGLEAMAFLYYTAFPPLDTDWASAGDLARLGAFLLVLIGALGEIGLYRRQAALAGRLRERERLARDLHDGVAQDLAFLSARLQELEEDPPAGMTATNLAHLSTAAKRALDASRQAISNLSLPLHLPLGAAVQSSAEEIATREEVALAVRADPRLEVSQEAKEAVLRIVREAVTNAIRHGRADRVTVVLESDDGGLLLRTQDDGAGFTAPRAGGVGLDSMRSRAAEHGGTTSVSSEPGKGTVVTVRLPPDVVSPAENSRSPEHPPKGLVETIETIVFRA